ncbi:OmpA family protein [Parapedobacter sp. 10938]|uniref:OmpA family protein n=1 Tax=Parapedobacter flavus TaxID=3110225 RepID=UPI002DBCCD54|nr:OmpA family protein [Parapedobacter sp. 10938]MEC3879657.1 OmpA family protein [Parapedobacter sp. 10938]
MQAANAIYILILLAVLYALPVAAQRGSNDRRAQRAFDKAGSQLKNQKYGLAVASLEEAISLDPEFAAAYQQLGDIYRKQRDYEIAVDRYRKVIRLDSTLTPLTWFGLGESLLHTGNYTDALAALNRYRDTPGLAAEGKRLTDKYIADCEFGVSAVRNPVPFSPQNAGPAINSRYDEYFPRLTADQHTIIFTRKKDDRENFFESSRDSSGAWTAASFLTGQINSDLYNEGAHCISPDGKYLFFTGCNRPDGLGSCDIYVSRREGTQWGTPHNLGTPVNTPGWEAQPALAADGRTLYFVSNRRGGQGGYDIWKTSLKSDGQWEAPQNLGPTINTPFDESSPYIHADNRTLYFASNGWPGLGNKDIFKSGKDGGGQWGKPVNLGYPINDHHEQSALTVSMNGAQAFFSTRRTDAIGGLDIYTFELPEASRPDPVAYLKGIIVDAESNTPLQAGVTVTDIASNRVLYDEQADYEDGTFLAPLPFGKTYALHVNQPGYLFFSESYPLADSTKINDAYEIRIPLSRIKVGKSTTLSNIFFETDRYTLLPQSKSDLEQLIKFLSLNSNVRIEIVGHTDNTGNDAYNQQLSENRAKAVYDYLLNAGISASRLSFKGYGPFQPVASNDTPEGRQLNRRTDFTIIE